MKAGQYRSVQLLCVRLRVLSVTKCLELEIIKIITVLATLTVVKLLLIEMLVCPMAKLAEIELQLTAIICMYRMLTAEDQTNQSIKICSWDSRQVLQTIYSTRQFCYYFKSLANDYLVSVKIYAVFFIRFFTLLLHTKYTS